MKKILLAMGLIVSASSAAFAVPLEVLHKRNEIMMFGGLQWNFGTSKPELVLGLRTEQSNRTSSSVGAKFDIAVPLDRQTWTQPTFRALGLAGNCDVQGEAGLGWSVGTNRPLFALGLQAPFSTAGVNYTVANSFTPYVGINSLSKPACAFKPNQGNG